jgi:hypothetical protein
VHDGLLSKQVKRLALLYRHSIQIVEVDLRKINSNLEDP